MLRVTFFFVSLLFLEWTKFRKNAKVKVCSESWIQFSVLLCGNGPGYEKDDITIIDPVDLIGTSPWIRKFLLVKYKDPRWEIVYRFPFHCYDWIGLGLDSGLSIIFLRMSLSSPQVVATARASPSPARATSWWRPGSRGWLSPQPRHLGGESQRPTLRSPSSISSRWEQSRYTWSIYETFECRSLIEGKTEREKQKI